MQTFCTIIDSRHIAFAKVLWQSLHAQNPSARLAVLITDHTSDSPISQYNETENFTCYDINSILNAPFAHAIYKKYAGTNNDQFRWALKPVFINWLLEKDYQKVIYLDADLYFIGCPDFLFDELNTASILLTPHWRNTNPILFEDGLYSMLREGVFNAGFVAASTSGKPAIEWWARLCHFRTDKVSELGLYDDQKYLDLLPAEFENVKIIQHRGCNLASWNIDTNYRVLIDGKMLINGIYEPIFIHFTKETIIHIQNGNDVLLKPYLNQYIKSLLLYGWNGEFLPEKSSFLYTLKKNTKIRTRLKQFLFRLAQRI